MQGLGEDLSTEISEYVNLAQLVLLHGLRRVQRKFLLGLDQAEYNVFFLYMLCSC